MAYQPPANPYQQGSSGWNVYDNFNNQKVEGEVPVQYNSQSDWQTGWDQAQYHSGINMTAEPLSAAGALTSQPGHNTNAAWAGVPQADKGYFGPVPYPEYQSILQGGSQSMPGQDGVIQRPTIGGGTSITQQYEQGLHLPTNLTMQSQYDSQYMDQLNQYANAEEASPWLNLQHEQIASEGATNRDLLEQQRLGGLTEAREGLAMRRGLSTGAGERLENAGMEAKMMENQRLSRELGEQGRMMTIAEEQAKLGVLEKMPGMEAQRATYESTLDQTNIANILAERAAEQQAQMQAYQTQMGAWAASQQADATAASAGSGGGGGCFITTAVCENLGLEDDNEILNSFRDLRDNFMKKDESMLAEVKEYYDIAPKIVELIKEDNEEIFKEILHKYLIPAFKDIKSGKKKEAYEIYVIMVNELKEKYIGKE